MPIVNTDLPTPVRARRSHRPSMFRHRDLPVVWTDSPLEFRQPLEPPRPQRQASEIVDLQTGTIESLREHWPAVLGRLRWDGFDAQRRWYGNEGLAQRLLAGLITAAARYNAAGETGPAILVRAIVHSDQWLLQLGVSVESGCFFGGRTSSATAAMLANLSERTELQVWHHLAGALLTTPRVKQRPNGGWAIEFDLPLDSPLGVAKQWAHWRLDQQAVVDEDNCQPYAWLETLLSNRLGSRPQHTDRAVLLTVVAGAAVSAGTLDTFQRRLDHEQTLFDLAYRVSPHRWVLVWDNTIDQARQRIEALAASWLQVNHPVRLHWSRIVQLPLCQRQTAALLSDRISRERLSDREPSRLGQDQVSEPLEALLKPSPVPTDRLVAEMRHLAARIRTQNEHLDRNVRELRPAAGQAV